MKIYPLNIPDVLLIEPERHYDERGYFTEIYRYDLLKKQGFDNYFVQDNLSFSQKKNTLRGLHYQLHPYGQSKLIRVIRGTIMDVAVDLRVGSPTFGNSVHCFLSDINGSALLVPDGFAHGFITLEDDTSVMYKTSQYYNKNSERSVLWSDPTFSIPWNVDSNDIIISHKDSIAPLLKCIKQEDLPQLL